MLSECFTEEETMCVLSSSLKKSKHDFSALFLETLEDLSPLIKEESFSLLWENLGR